MEMFVSEDIGVKEYFEEFVPRMFREQLEKSPVTGMEGTIFAAEFDISNGTDQAFGITVKDGRELEINEGPLDNPMVRIQLSEEVWRKAVTGKMVGAVDMFTDMEQMANRQRFEALKSTQGTMNLVLSLPDGSVANIKVIMNGAESPFVTFMTTAEDWAKMATGDLTGPAAFMSGRLKIDGDLAFAMSLGNMMY